MNLIARILNLKNRYQSLCEFECTLIDLSGEKMKLSGKTYISFTFFGFLVAQLQKLRNFEAKVTCRSTVNLFTVTRDIHWSSCVCNRLFKSVVLFHLSPYTGSYTVRPRKKGNP